MTLHSALFPDIANPLSKAVMKIPGVFNVAVPALIGGIAPKWCRTSGRGCGGQGASYGGGGAYSRSRFPVTPGENLIVQIGSASQASVLGDTYVMRNDGTTVLLYADRGRGSGQGGLASNGVGDVKRDGMIATQGGGGGLDDADGFPMLGPSLGLQPGIAYPGVSGTSNSRPPGPGARGVLGYITDDVSIYRMAFPAGPGVLAIEFFDADPGL